eukprot:6187847-Pyramimonas_sp.AAC.1
MEEERMAARFSLRIASKRAWLAEGKQQPFDAVSSVSMQAADKSARTDPASHRDTLKRLETHACSTTASSQCGCLANVTRCGGSCIDFPALM